MMPVPRVRPNQGPDQLDALLNHADRLRAANDDRALALYDAVLRDRPCNMQALMGQGMMARARGDLNAALSHFTSAANANPMDFWPQDSLLELHLEAGHWPQAKALANTILQHRPEHLPAQMALGLAARAGGDHAAALAWFTTAALSNQDHPWPNEEILAEHRSQGRWRAADAAARVMLVATPNSLAALVTRGLAARHRGNRPGALTWFEAALACHPAHPWPGDLLLEELRGGAYWAEARDAAAAILKVNANSVPAWITRGLAARALGEADGARAWFEAACRAGPDNIWARDLLLEEYRNAALWLEADATAESILATMPGHLPALVTRGQAAQARGERAAAIAWYEAACTAAPGDLWPRDLLMWCSRDAGELGAADALARGLLRDAPDHMPALMVLGLNARDRGALGDAITALRAAREIAPQNPWPRNALAQTMREDGDWTGARALLAAALAEHPGDWSARLELARLLRGGGEIPGAVALLRAREDIAPPPVEALVEYAGLRLDEGETDEALALLEQALQAQPNDLGALLVQARANLIAQRLTAARQGLEKALAAHPLRPEPSLDLAELHWLAGNAEAAEACLASAAACAPGDPRPAEARARHARQAERPQQAATLFREALALRPLSVSAHAGLIDSLAACADFAGATQAGEEAERRLGALPALRWARVAALHLQGHWPEALELARASVQPGDGATGLRLWQARLELLLHGPETAEATLARITPQRPLERAEHLVLQGLAAEARWQLDRAASFYELAERAAPMQSGVHWNAARNALLRLEIPSARQHLRQALSQGRAARQVTGRSGNVSQTHAGQVLDEFSFDRALLEEVRSVVALPLAERVVGLAALVLAAPQSTAAACQLLLAQRQARPSRKPKQSGSAAPIPHRFCQYWSDPEPPADAAALMASWQIHHPDFTLERFHDNSAWAFLQAHCPPAVANAFRRAAEPAMRADLFRLAWLQVRGGIYVDADDRCHGSLTPLLRPGRSLLLYLEDWATVGNNLIGAAPGEPIIGAALTQAVDAIARGDRDMVWLSTGPAMLTRQVAAVAASPAGLPSSVAILDKEALQQLVSMHCFLAYKTSERHWSNTTFARGARQGRDIAKTGAQKTADAQPA